MNLRSVLIIVSGFFLLLFVALLVFGKFASSKTLIEAFSGVKYLVYEDLMVDKSLYQKDNFVLIKNQDKNKDLQSLLNMSKTVALSSQGLSGGLREVVNPFPASIKARLVKSVTEDTPVSVIFNNETNTISFEIDVDAKIFSFTGSDSKLVLWKMSNVFLGDLFSIGNDNKFLIEKDGFVGVFPLRALKNKDVYIYRETDKDVLGEQGQDFDSGLWKNSVEDCSQYLEGEGKMSMSLLGEPGKGNVLQLSSSNHYACTSKDFKIKLDKNKQYIFRFGYKNIAGNKIKVGYHFGYDDQATEDDHVFFEKKTSVGSWKNVSLPVSYLPDPVNMKVHLYAPSDGQDEVVNLFDRVALSEFSLDFKFNLEYDLANNFDVDGSSVLLNSGSTTLGGGEKRNILDSEEAGFEDGSWPVVVSDCTASQAGDPDVSLRYVDYKDRGKILELASNNHSACVSHTFDVDVVYNKSYLFSFDYLNLQGRKVQYFYQLSDSVSGKVQSKSVTFEADKKEFLTRDELIVPTLDRADKFTVFFYAPSDGSRKVTTLFDNISLSEKLPVDIDKYKLFIDRDSSLLKSFTVNHLKSSYLNQKVLISGVDRSFLLVHNSPFSNMLFAKNVSKDKHFRYNGSVNAFVIDPGVFCESAPTKCFKNDNGSYSLTVDFGNKIEYLVIFSIIFLVFFICCIYFINKVSLPKITYKQFLFGITCLLAICLLYIKASLFVLLGLILLAVWFDLVFDVLYFVMFGVFLSMPFMMYFGFEVLFLSIVVFYLLIVWFFVILTRYLLYEVFLFKRK